MVGSRSAISTSIQGMRCRTVPLAAIVSLNSVSSLPLPLPLLVSCFGLLRTRCRLSQPLARVRCWPGYRLWGGSTSLINAGIPFFVSYLLDPLHHPASQEVFKEIRVAIRVLHIIATRFQLLQRLLNTFPNREVHILLGSGEAIHLLQGQLHLPEDSQLLSVPLVEPLSVLLHLSPCRKSGAYSAHPFFRRIPLYTNFYLNQKSSS